MGIVLSHFLGSVPSRKPALFIGCLCSRLTKVQYTLSRGVVLDGAASGSMIVFMDAKVKTLVLSVLAFIPACAFTAAQGRFESMNLKSEAFATGEAIPAIHSYSGKNLSPPLEWRGVPGATESLALICDDPDAPKAGGWVHWVVWDIPASSISLAQGLPKGARLKDGMRQGLNDWREPGWGGPQPPTGTHHYSFRLYALDTILGDLGALTRDGLLKAMAGHVIAQAELVGLYSAR